MRVKTPIKGSLIIASIDGQTINIEKTTLSEITIMLNDDMINMDREIIVKYMGNEIFNSTVPRDINIIEKSIKEYGDPQSVYFTEILLSLDKFKSR